MRRTPAPSLAVALLAAALFAPCAAAQDAPQPKGAELPPGAVLGRRAGMAMASRKVIPVVVVVPDPASYADAVAEWTPEAIYPVLIDDGSWEATQNIARFVRGFRPDAVVRWSADAAKTRGSREMRARRAVPRARALAFEAFANSWGVGVDDDAGAAETDLRLVRRWIELNHAPPGVVIADERDPAWTAALAIAAARGEPICWLTLPKLVVDATLSPEEAEGLCSQIEQYCADTHLEWAGLGDLLDAVTICAALPARIQTGQGEFVATTDDIGRLAAPGSAEMVRTGARWAWAGQVFGSEPEAAYRAMCGIFLRIHSAWIFDGYGSTEPWVQWDGTKAGDILKQAGLAVAVEDEPHNTLRDWRLRAERPIRADLVLVNSSGNRGFFNLPGGKGEPGDTPFLDVPAAMHMAHSFSAAAPGRRETVAGRWLERGVYAYVGSVHEPFLQAFVPTPVLAQRLLGGFALGAAARLDNGPVWRIAVVGDPLVAWGPDPERIAAETPLEGVAPVADDMKTAATEGRYADAVRGLVLLGRDSDAARLVAALLRDKPEVLDAPLAREALFALFSTGMDAEFLRCYAALTPEDASDGAAVDALWFVGRRAVREQGGLREAAISLLAAHAREDQRESDAAELLQLGAGRP
ncbi:MAG: hypothetical protein IPJ41_01310 [Phycisphaerales bacterium]|nr:hypothetical protein [Phycisphaerales bacterium]